jgi:hypothetical protein
MNKIKIIIYVVSILTLIFVLSGFTLGYISYKIHNASNIFEKIDVFKEYNILNNMHLITVFLFSFSFMFLMIAITTLYFLIKKNEQNRI